MTRVQFWSGKPDDGKLLVEGVHTWGRCWSDAEIQVLKILTQQISITLENEQGHQIVSLRGFNEFCGYHVMVDSQLDTCAGTVVFRSVPTLPAECHDVMPFSPLFNTASSLPTFHFPPSLPFLPPPSLPPLLSSFDSPLPPPPLSPPLLVSTFPGRELFPIS